MGTLYLLTFSNGKHYVGQTTQPVLSRYKAHARGRYQVGAAWKKHGAPLLTVIGSMPKDELDAAEIAMIAALGSMTPNGYNVTPGGGISPLMIASIRARGVATRTGRKYGPLSEECKAKISAALKGRVFTAEHRANHKAACPKTHSPEHTAKVAAALRGKKRHRRPATAETRERCRLAALARYR